MKKSKKRENRILFSRIPSLFKVCQTSFSTTVHQHFKFFFGNRKISPVYDIYRKLKYRVSIAPTKKVYITKGKMLN